MGAPMATVRRYLFDRDFDAPEDEPTVAEPGSDALGDSLGESPHADEVEPEPEPTYSQADLDAAREVGLAEGYNRGVLEAADSLERLVAACLEKLNADVDELFRVQEAANDAIASNAVDIAVAVVRKLFPAYSASHGLGEIEALVLDILKRLQTEPQVRLEIHPSLNEALAARFDACSALMARRDRVILLPNPGLAPGDCVAQWTNGGAERLTETIWNEIAEIVARNGGPKENSEPRPATPVIASPAAFKAARAQP